MQTDTSPGESAVAVTPSDSTGVKSRALFVGGAGDLSVTMTSGQDCVFTGVLAGTLLPISVRVVKAATTATNIVAIY
jgi:hypothetical protein